MKLYVFGPAGVGKTTFIQAIRDQGSPMLCVESIEPPSEGYEEDGSRSVQLLPMDWEEEDAEAEPPASDSLLWIDKPTELSRSKDYWEGKARTMVRWLESGPIMRVGR
jgi:GTPase SAR1 family protein